MLVKRGSQQVYNITFKSEEWLIVNVVVNAKIKFLLKFYFFKGEGNKDNYIRYNKP